MFTSSAPARSFQKSLSLLVGILLTVCAVLAILTWLQGPRIRTAVIDPQGVTTQSGQRLLLFANQSLNKLTTSQVDISPNVPIEVKSSGNTVVIQFVKKLQYDTTYKVTLRPEGKRSIEHRFKTAPAAMYYVHHVESPTHDEIRHATLSNDKFTKLFDAENIADFAVLKDSLVVNVRNKDYTNTLHLVDIKTKKTRVITLPDTGGIEHLQAAPNGESFGYVFTPKARSGTPTSQLYTHLTTETAANAVKGFDNKTLLVSAWRFAADSATLLVQTFDNSAFVLRTGLEPLPLGQFSSVRGFSSDNRSAFLQDTLTPVIVNLETNAREKLAAKPLGERSFTTDVQPLQNSNGYLLRGQAFTNDHYVEYLLSVIDGRQKMVHDITRDKSIIRLDLSPNDEYVGVEISQVRDGKTTRHTDIIHVESGRAAADIDGTLLRWQP